MSADITAKGGFMAHRRLITVAVAVIVPFALVNAVVISDSAAVGPTAAPGSITCSYGTTTSPVKLSFKPPLTKVGTIVHTTAQPSEVITVSKASLGSCKQTKGSTPPVTKGMATAAITAKIPGVKLGAGKWSVGDCPTFEQMLWAKGLKPTFTWTGTPFAGSSLITRSGARTRAGTLGFIASGTASGSFAGANSNITAYFTAGAASAISTACGGGTGKVLTAGLSAATSTIHLGT